MERISRYRAIVLLMIFIGILTLYSIKLFDLQIIETDGNRDNTTVYSTITTVRAARGDILDRNGKVLVGNRASYDLVFNHYVIKSADNRNDHLYRLYHKCKELGIDYLDHFPITRTRPFEYTLHEYPAAWQRYFQNFMVDLNMDPDVTAPLLLERLRGRYKIPDTWNDEEARAVIGMRYEFDLRGVTNLPNYIFIEDVSDDDLSAILELNIPGLMVESSTVREYHTKYAAHVLGYLGGMDADEWETFKEQGYSMDAQVGQTGFEEAFEEYLHGIDGQRLDKVSKDGSIISQTYIKNPQAGANVETTLDLAIQRIAEEALAKRMNEFLDPNTYPANDDAEDAEGAAVIVMEVKTGKILACASYPSFNLATMHDDWAKIEADPLKPFFNRAFGAYYAPGSSFKPCTLVAAMRSGKLLPDETVETKGVFNKYPGFEPTCMIWSHNPGVTHGTIDGSKALEVSCNYFFYEMGDRLTIEMLDDTAKGFGLGEPTGIELVEKIGWRANPESKKHSYTGLNANWFVGDKILAAVGQSENRFTPLQLAVYACTLANQGTRYKATFLNRVVSSDYRTLILERKPEIASKMDISNEIYNTYMEGMHNVIKGVGGTANKYFGGWNDPKGRGYFPVEVCAKTGTAQHSSGGSDHGAFICFAPMENPEIAVAVYGEKVAHGGWLAPVAQDILTAYFEMESASDVFTFENRVG